MKILVVDDDLTTIKMIKFLLMEEGYEVVTAESPRGAQAILDKEVPQLILLDVTMPLMNGFEFCQKLREGDYDIPIIFISAKGELNDRLKGLSIGGDDYIVKPFAPAELLARVEAVLRRYRRTQSSTNTVLHSGNLEVNLNDLLVKVNEKKVFVTPTEMKILWTLLQHTGQIVTRDDLLLAVWGENYVGESNIVDVYIRRLRRKIEHDPAAPTYIQSARGIGYKFVGEKS